MSTIIRDINGNRSTHKLRHYLLHAVNTGLRHIDSTGLHCVDYMDGKGGQWCAFIRPENEAEANACVLAERLGTPRQ